MKVNVFEDGEIRIVPFDENETWVELTAKQEELLGKGLLGYKNGQLVDLTAHYAAQEEIYELKDWFTHYYTEHEQKYNRLIALEKLCDDGSNPQTKLLALYNEAETKRARIQELELI